MDKKKKKKKKKNIAKMEKTNYKNTCHDYISQTPTKSGSHFHLSVNNYTKKKTIDYTNENLINNNVLSIFSYSLRYMDKKSLNKWLRQNIRAPFYDTFVPKNKPIAYIRFKNHTELKTFAKLIENKQFHENDNMSAIKIHKSEEVSKKRKLHGISNNDDSNGKLERKKFKKEKKEKRDRKEREGQREQGTKLVDETVTEETQLLDLQSIIKLNKQTKNKTIENFVTPFFKYPYMDQVKIKHDFLKKCKRQILKNLQKKWEKQNLLFGNEERFSISVSEEPCFNTSNGIINKNSLSSETGSANISNERRNKKNETSTDSCLKSCVLKSITVDTEEKKKDALEKMIKEYDFEVDNPIFPDESGRRAYRNKCEFTIAYDENGNVEIGFVIGKLKQNVIKTSSDNFQQEDGNCNYSENNISDNNVNPLSVAVHNNDNMSITANTIKNKNNKGDLKSINNNNSASGSPINETHSTKLRNKKIKEAYYLNPVVESVDKCIHVHDCMKSVIKVMKEIIKESTYPVFDRVYKTGVWRLLVMRTNSKKELLIMVQTYSLDQKKKKEIKKLLINRLTKEEDDSRKYFNGYKVVSLYLQEHENANDSTNESMNEHLWGEGMLEETILSNRFLISPAAFFQVNHTSCQLLYSKVITYVNIKKNMKNYIFDLCCGTGTIGINVVKALEKKDIHLIGIELCGESIDCANKNAELNKVQNYKFIEGRIEDQFPIEIKNIKEKNVNIIAIVDPPRNGLVKSLISTLTSNSSINQIIYVSCNPITLVQNVTTILLQDEKMRIKNMSFVDMFPHTFHVECIVNMIRK